MTKQVLFIQGAGAGAYAEDKALAGSLQRALGAGLYRDLPPYAGRGGSPV